MDKLLNLENISLTYHSKKSETLALDKLSFALADQDFVSIVGPSGCGKSTILSLISGLLKPTKGIITLGGEKMDLFNVKRLWWDFHWTLICVINCVIVCVIRF